jgi:hypothetical protein
MELVRLHRRIAQLQDEFLRMQKSRNWYRHRYQWACHYFHDHGIPMPWGSETVITTDDADLEFIPDEPVPLPMEVMRRQIMHDLLTNSKCATPARHFSLETLAFSFVADMYSSLAYRFIREVLPLPSEVTIRTRYRGTVSEIEERLIDLTK